MSNLVTIPWHDGSEREVEYDTLCLDTDGDFVQARNGGWAYYGGSVTHPWGAGIYATAIFTKVEEPPEPPLKLPTTEGAIIAAFKDGKATGWSASLGYDGCWEGYRNDDSVYSPSQLRAYIEGWPRLTFKVIFEGEGSDE